MTYKQLVNFFECLNRQLERSMKREDADATVYMHVVTGLACVEVNGWLVTEEEARQQVAAGNGNVEV